MTKRWRSTVSGFRLRNYSISPPSYFAAQFVAHRKELFLASRAPAAALHVWVCSPSRIRVALSNGGSAAHQVAIDKYEGSAVLMVTFEDGDLIEVEGVSIEYIFLPIIAD